MKKAKGKRNNKTKQKIFRLYGTETYYSIRQREIERKKQEERLINSLRERNTIRTEKWSGTEMMRGSGRKEMERVREKKK